MSVKSEAGSAEGWCEDYPEETDRFGSTTARRDDLGDQRHLRDVEDVSSEEKQFFSHPESDRQPLPVVMETASTGNAVIPCTLYVCKAASDICKWCFERGLVLSLRITLAY